MADDLFRVQNVIPELELLNVPSRECGAGKLAASSLMEDPDHFTNLLKDERAWIAPGGEFVNTVFYFYFKGRTCWFSARA